MDEQYEGRHRPTIERVGTPRAWALGITATLRETSGVSRHHTPRHSAAHRAGVSA